MWLKRSVHLLDKRHRLCEYSSSSVSGKCTLIVLETNNMHYLKEICVENVVVEVQSVDNMVQ